MLTPVYIKTKTFNGSGLSGIGGTIGVAVLFAAVLRVFFIYIGANHYFY